MAAVSVSVPATVTASRPAVTFTVIEVAVRDTSDTVTLASSPALSATVHEYPVLGNAGDQVMVWFAAEAPSSSIGTFTEA